MATTTRVGNPWRKLQDKNHPYALYRSSDGWEWRVLKAYQTPGKELNNQFARWYCFVITPMCPEGEYGDTYCHEILAQGTKVEIERCKVEVIADTSETWAGNALEFLTRGDAEAYAKDLYSRWTAVRSWRVVPVVEA